MRPCADRTAFAAFLLLALIAPAALAAPAGADRPRSPQQRRRLELIEQVGLDKQNQSAPAKPETPTETARPGVPPAGEAAPERDHPVAGPQGSRLAPPVTPSFPSFRRDIFPLLNKDCKACHSVGAVAQATPFVLSGKVETDHRAALRSVDLRAPAASGLLAKVSGGKPHAGGAPWSPRSATYRRVLAWIKAGAHIDEASPAPPVVPVTTPPRAAPRPRPPREVAPDSAVRPMSNDVSTVDAATPALAAASKESSASEVVPRVDFAGAVHPLLMQRCSGCHGPLGSVPTTHFVLVGDIAGDHANVRALIDPATPAQSQLITKGAGQNHGGGAVVQPGSAEHSLLLAWIAAGATDGTRPTDSILADPPAAAASGASAPVPRRPDTPAPVPATGRMNHAQGGAGVGLPYGLALNGKFDLAYERQGVAGNPFAGSATNALRSYHHFLFLSRESSGDPIGFAVEMLSLQFWEARFRWRAAHRPVQVTIAAGKILVPFGADPLTHQSYGGLAGFDQRVLPVVWAREGAAVHLVVHRRELAVTDDLYVVRGYALRQASAVINLQNDFASEDAARLGIGNRLGVSWGPFGVWYSAYYNPLGFGRRLFMQAADVMLWRVRQVPVLGHFSLAAGLMRADVSGGDAQGTGGPGRDYYHFASYLQVRYHPTDWLYVQYRQGLRTFNNRRGVILDDTRLSSDDASAHNFGVVARHRGLSGGLHYFVNLEKADEIPNDFLRASLSYDF